MLPLLICATIGILVTVTAVLPTRSSQTPRR